MFMFGFPKIDNGICGFYVDICIGYRLLLWILTSFFNKYFAYGFDIASVSRSTALDFGTVRAKMGSSLTCLNLLSLHDGVMINEPQVGWRWGEYKFPYRY